MTKSKIMCAIIALCLFFAVCGAFFAAGYITGAQTQKSECARKISEINAAAANHVISAETVARRAVVTTTTAEKIQWLKDNRAIK